MANLQNEPSRRPNTQVEQGNQGDAAASSKDQDRPGKIEQLNNQKMPGYSPLDAEKLRIMAESGQLSPEVAAVVREHGQSPREAAVEKQTAEYDLSKKKLPPIA